MAHSLIPADLSNIDIAAGVEPAELPERDRVDLSLVQMAAFGEEFPITELQRQLADEYIRNGSNVSKAGYTVRPKVAKSTARAWASRTLKDPGVVSYIKWRRAQIVMESDVSAAELIAKQRLVYLQATGQARVRKTVVGRDDVGDVSTFDEQIYDPSLTAANAAVDNLRKIAGIGAENKTLTIRASVEAMTSEERQERLKQILSEHAVIEHES